MQAFARNGNMVSISIGQHDIEAREHERKNGANYIDDNSCNGYYPNNGQRKDG